MNNLGKYTDAFQMNMDKIAPGESPEVDAGANLLTVHQAVVHQAGHHVLHTHWGDALRLRSYLLEVFEEVDIFRLIEDLHHLLSLLLQAEPFLVARSHSGKQGIAHGLSVTRDLHLWAQINS